MEIPGPSPADGLALRAKPSFGSIIFPITFFEIFNEILCVLCASVFSV